MCNAWNHSVNCTCRWGGTGHAGRRSSGDAAMKSYWRGYVPYITWHIDSYVNPNARCPVCGASVLYYCNEHGSSVFFDELGPPGPKHSCTDNEKKYVALVLEGATRKVVENNYQWMRDHWELHRVINTVNLDNTAFKLVLEKDGTEMDVFVSKSDLGISKYVDIFRNGIAVFFNKNLRIKKLSLLTPSAKPILLSAYTSLFYVPRRGIKIYKGKKI